MLMRFRIEVEEETAERCVEALWKYEHALVQQEVRRYRHLWGVTGSSEHVNTPEEEYPTPEHPWSDDLVPRWFYNEQLGREVTEEVIEYDESIPGYRGRRVVRFARIDMRRSPEVVIGGHWNFNFGASGGILTGASGSNPTAAPPTLSPDEPDRGSS